MSHDIQDRFDVIVIGGGHAGAQPARSGGTHGDRNGDRHRYRAVPDSSRQGPACTGPRSACPLRSIPLYGYALQCRITTEDPANNFMPDYGKIQTYRSPAGFGIRLDGGSAYGGAASPLTTIRCW